MEKKQKKNEHRIELYSIGAAVVGVLLLVGFVYDPGPQMSLKDWEADLAIQMAIGNVEEALVDIDEILKRDPENLYGLLMKAHIRETSGKTEEALSLYIKGFASVGRCAHLEDDILDTIAILALRSGRYPVAQEYANLKIDRFGENVISRIIIALSFFSLHDDKRFEENLGWAMQTGIADPAFKLKLKHLLGDGDQRSRLYRRILLEQAKWEQRVTGMPAF